MESRFNRTFMELKYIRQRLLQEAYGGFNRTFMELKSDNVPNASTEFQF